MSEETERSRVLRNMVATAVAAATPASFVTAATPPAAPTRVATPAVMELADGKKIQFTFKDGVITGRVLDAKGALVNPTPTGKLALKSGKVLSFDKTGRLTDGLVMDNTGFVLLCDPGPSPPCPKP